MTRLNALTNYAILLLLLIIIEESSWRDLLRLIDGSNPRTKYSRRNIEQITVGALTSFIVSNGTFRFKNYQERKKVMTFEKSLPTSRGSCNCALRSFNVLRNLDSIS